MTTVKSNKNIPVINIIQKVLPEPYSASLTSICMLDFLNKDLNIEICFQDITDLEIFYALCFNIWKTYKNIPLKIRSFKNNNSYLEKYNDMNMETVFNTTLTLSDFGNNKFIIDIEYKESIYKESIYKIYFHLVNEGGSRVLILKC